MKISRKVYSTMRLFLAIAVAFLLAYEGVPSIVILVFFGFWFVIEYLIFEWDSQRDKTD